MIADIMTKESTTANVTRTNVNVDSILKNHAFAEEKESTRGQRTSSKYIVGDSSEGSHGEST